ncbi:glycosyltransferase [Plantibacter sp. Mn2098]|uniref:glycosyltransferase family 2 protein n=1 Tax=Plantibacter sp. Mn2098 TaxID=3395266 RepID=UPI003BC331A8
MSPRVSAILVVRDGTQALARTLEALNAQTRPADGIIVVASRSSDATLAVIAAHPAVKLVQSSEELSFGQAVAVAVRVTDQPTDPGQTLWLLAEDSAPEPDALAALLGALEVSPSVAVAGPKVLDWDDPKFLRRYGETITTLGNATAVVEDELDQAQHDTLNDVMAVGPTGMLVRHQVWDQLGGFDPALVADDALDFCIRARLAGYLVTVVPTARVASAGTGIAGPSWSNKLGARRRRHRLARAAQLHRRLVYAPAVMVVIHWLSLVPLAIIRVIGDFIKKQPELVLGELAAAFGVAFSGTKVGNARRQLAKQRTLGWSSIAGLRMKLDEVRRLRALKREASQIGVVGEERDLRFFSGGGAWVVLGAAVLGAGALAPLLGATFISGGALLPLSHAVSELWNQIGYGWRDVGLGFTGAADPFSAVLAVLGSITFWEPSFSLVLLFLLALPLSALGAWFAATRLTERSGARAVAAILWTIAPPLLSALADGRPAAVIVHVLLPWLFYAGAVAARSWAAAGASALIFAAIAASSPSLIPALVILWVIVAAVSGRGIARVLLIPIPAIALFAPLVWQQGFRLGNWLGLLADPGAVAPGTVSSGWQLALGFPLGGLGGWSQIAAALGLPGLSPVIAVPVLLAPLAILALIALFLPGTARAAFLLFAAFLGFVTAFAASHLFLSSTGSEVVPVWAGAALSLYWLGLVGAATRGLDAIKRNAAIPALVIVLATAVVAVPLVIAQPLGTSVVAESSGRSLPAYVTAATEHEPRLGTLIITPQADGSIAGVVVRGAGETLEKRSTIVQTARGTTADDQTVATLAGNLASQSGLDPTKSLVEHGIGFVLLAPAASTGDSSSTTAAQTSLRALTALNANAALISVGETQTGSLWRAVADVGTGPAIPKQPVLGTLIAVGLGVVFLIVILLSVPTGAARDGYRAGSRKLPVKEKGRGKRGAADGEAADADVTSEDAPVGADGASGAGEDGSALAEGAENTDAADAAAAVPVAKPVKTSRWRKRGAAAAGGAAAVAAASTEDAAATADDAAASADAPEADTSAVVADAAGAADAAETAQSDAAAPAESPIESIEDAPVPDETAVGAEPIDEPTRVPLVGELEVEPIEHQPEHDGSVPAPETEPVTDLAEPTEAQADSQLDAEPTDDQLADPAAAEPTDEAPAGTEAPRAD